MTDFYSSYTGPQIDAAVGAVFNVKQFGAMGNGMTDDSAAIAAVIAMVNAEDGGTIFFPAGTYVCSVLSLGGNTRLLGASPWASILKIVPGAAHLLTLNAVRNSSIENLGFLGSSPTMVYGVGSTIGGETAILVANNSATRILNCRVTGFNASGIEVQQTGTDTSIYGDGLTLNNVRVDYCFQGLTLDNAGQYVQIMASNFFKCYLGVLNYGGNNAFIGCQFNSNYQAYALIGGGGNEAHGSIIGCTFNHNTAYGLFASSLLLGQNIVGCFFYESAITVSACTGLRFVGCHFAVTTMTLAAGGVCLVADSTFDASYGGTITHSSDHFIMSNNHWIPLENNEIDWAKINTPVVLFNGLTLYDGEVYIETADLWLNHPSGTGANDHFITGGTLRASLQLGYNKATIYAYVGSNISSGNMEMGNINAYDVAIFTNGIANTKMYVRDSDGSLTLGATPGTGAGTLYAGTVNAGSYVGLPAFALLASPTFTGLPAMPSVRLTAAAPSSSSDTGTAGEIRVDGSYVYICTATNVWKRIPIEPW